MVTRSEQTEVSDRDLRVGLDHGLSLDDFGVISDFCLSNT